MKLMKRSIDKFMDKRGIVSDYLPWLLIGVAVLTIILLSVFFMKGQGFSLIDKIKNIFRS